jgi:D-beta-D-heptose 7-phosphate kinase/D-beta-D-heptose 1-phosphate adenosyltransferase
MAPIESKIYTPLDLQRTIAGWHLCSRRTVFTNGCFDLIHPGHLHYLHAARGLGDYLVVGLNTDDSVRRLKGEGRPIMDEQARARLLASLFFVDAVVLFDEDTPLELIKTLRPDVLVKGGDYTEDQVVGAPEVRSWGGSVELIPFVEGYSSSAIIEKIKSGSASTEP